MHGQQNMKFYIKMYIKETGLEGMDWIYLVLDMDIWWVL
jgi:hypothetical protein